MSTTASLVGALASGETTPAASVPIGADAGAFAQVLAAIEGETPELETPPEPPIEAAAATAVPPSLAPPIEPVTDGPVTDEMVAPPDSVIIAPAEAALDLAVAMATNDPTTTAAPPYVPTAAVDEGSVELSEPDDETSTAESTPSESSAPPPLVATAIESSPTATDEIIVDDTTWSPPVATTGTETSNEATERTAAIAARPAATKAAPEPALAAASPTIATTPATDAVAMIDAPPTIDTAAPPAPSSIDTLSSAPPAPAPLDVSPRAPIDTPARPPVVLARAEDLALAIEELRPIPRGGATVEVEAPGLGAIRLHVAVDGDTVKIRIHAGSDAIAWFAREHDGLCSAARQAVPESQGVDLQLHTGSDSRGNQPQPHARTYVNDETSQPHRSRMPSPRSEAPPSPTSSHALVDVLA